MSASGRQNVEITITEQAGDGSFVSTDDSIEFTYQFPFVDVSSSTRNVTHEPLDEEAVIQSLGPEVREITLEGHCYLDEANFIDDLSANALIEVVTDRWSGFGIVQRAETSATGQGGGKEGTIADRIYEYRIELGEVTGNLPASIGNVS